jgi:two-component system NtrC family sensor kinase
MASLGELTAGIAHEIKNPLNFVINFSETSVELLDELKEALEPVQGNLDEDTRDDVDDIFGTLKGDLEKINHHGRRADNIVKSMLLHARGEASERVLTQVNDLVEEALNLAYHGERARDKNFHATLEQDFDDTAGQAKLIPQEVTRVLVNLFSNAFFAVKTRARDGGSGTYAPTVTVWTKDKGGNVQIRIRDNGTGIPEDVREKLFDPFFTTKPPGEGTGLGLSMSFDIITQQHGGQIDVDSEPGEFTEFTITLPRHLDGTSQLSDRGNQI